MKVLKHRVTGQELKEALAYGTVPVVPRFYVGFKKDFKGKIVHIFSMEFVFKTEKSPVKVKFVDQEGKEDFFVLSSIHGKIPAYFSTTTV